MEAECLSNSGVAMAKLCDWKGALDRFRESLKLLQSYAGDERAKWILYNLGTAEVFPVAGSFH
jgi:hypothetical protein